MNLTKVLGWRDDALNNSDDSGWETMFHIPFAPSGITTPPHG
ncbi:MAG: hypothetical protein ACP5R2_03285 [Anaerolineae bacterium]